MRRLGASLDVEAMAVYKHFPNKAAILDGVVAATLRPLDGSVAGDDWREAFRTTFRSLRSVLHTHPNTLPLVASRPLASPQLTRRLESTRDLLLRSLSEDAVLRLLHAGLSLTLGYLWLEAGGFVGELPNETPFLRATADAETNVDASSRFTSRWSPNEDFAAGLELLLVDPARQAMQPAASTGRSFC
jgi:AcrR family transcriptional regulator